MEAVGCPAHREDAERHVAAADADTIDIRFDAVDVQQ
jgi:hypothetical protein